ncbi:sulfate ABC transporter substrate-binding protein (plasmid) [Thioclava sp. 'Guangxiensis']|uniref:sulfate ABC transporter substrate-binding protein n=1 Tax=Thioclava sp. 'Guangxiensis' TaxID=3149044 RepID=UPI0032C40C01
MLRTIQIGSHVLAQGTFIRSLGNGRIEIDTGNARVSGLAVTGPSPRTAEGLSFIGAFRRAVARGYIGALGIAALGAGLALSTPAPLHAESIDILNVSYDPTREFYKDYNILFNDWWVSQGHDAANLRQSHGGSGGQARAVIDGLEATVVTLALAPDVSAIAEKTGKIPADWQSRLPHQAAPYSSTIVFLVRKDNPKGIKDWADLVRDDVSVITPNPKTSGGARWNVMAAWAWAQKEFGGDEAKSRAYLADLFAHVPVLDTGARGATNTFVKRGLGDVLLAWENEAFLALAEQGEDAFEIVVPSVSILAEPPVALVDGNITSEAQRETAEAYLTHLYSPEAQALALKNYYRAWDLSQAAPEDIARFPELDRVSIDQFGGWEKVQPEFFGDGGIFDQIYGAQ